MATSAPEQLETVDRCPLCGYEHFTTAFSEGQYSVRRCSRCGMGWVSPRLAEAGLQAIYQADSYWRSESPKTRGYFDYRSQEQLYLDTFRRRLEFVLRGGPHSGRALDVGCAAGFCMAALRERGFEAHGLEVSETIGSHARDHFGFDTVHFGTLEDSPYPDSHFALITMWDVVEHVVDPAALLAKAVRLLAPNGLLVIETQDIDSRFARLLGPRWHHYKHAEHICHFTPATIRTLLGNTGFRVQRLTHRYGGKYVSFEFIAERAGRVHPALSKALRPLTALRGGRLYLNFFDEMIVLARPV